MTSTFTADFRHEFEAERERWLQRRFLWYSGILAGWNALKVLVHLLTLAGVFGDRVTVGASTARIDIGVSAVLALAFAGAFQFVRVNRLHREHLLSLTGGLIFFVGVITIVVGPVVAGLTINLDAPPAQRELAEQLTGLSTIFGILVAHFIASLFIPWTPREALRPLIPLLVIYAAFTLAFSGAPLLIRVVFIALSPLIAVPGLAVAAWRQSRFKDRLTFRLLKGRYGEMKQELVNARQIHESLFPAPIREGPVRCEYRYEPMRQIGGDYLFARSAVRPGAPLPLLHLTLLDVTGHGIGAALTVNRLHGEIVRQYGETPDADPGRILTGLNAYLHHTLATHSVYATALCITIDPNTDTIFWASAGHPPAFLRTADGRIDRLDSTTFVLGATHGDDFQHGQQSARFGRGDTLIIYTDGAIESRDQRGRMLGIRGFERIIASGHPDEEGGWAASILRAVDEHRHGPPQDDTLIVEVWRPL